MSDADCTPGREPRSIAASYWTNVWVTLCGLSALVSSPALIQHGGSSTSDLLRSHHDAETHHIVSNTRHMTSAARPSRTSLTRSHSDVSRDTVMSASRSAVTVDNRRLSLDTHQLPQQHQYQHHAVPVRMFLLSFLSICIVVFIVVFFYFVRVLAGDDPLIWLTWKTVTQL